MGREFLRISHITNFGYVKIERKKKKKKKSKHTLMPFFIQKKKMFWGSNKETRWGGRLNSEAMTQTQETDKTKHL